MFLSNNELNRKNKLFLPLTFLIIIIGIISSIFTSFAIHNANKKNLIDRANTIAQAIDINDIKNLKGDNSDLNNAEYQKIKILLMKVQAINNDIRFVYINGIKDNQLFFYIDSENTQSRYYSAPGQKYPEATNMMKDIFISRDNGFEIASDRWGLWASVYIALRDENNNTIALLGNDVYGISYILDVIVYGSIPLLLALLILIFIFSIKRRYEQEQYFIEQKDEFLSVASHEIRTPLTGIRWATENIINNKEKIPEEEKIKTILLIHENTISLINRINNLLNFSSLNSINSAVLRKDTVMIKPIIDEIVRGLNLSALSKKVIIDTNNFPKDISIYCDYEKIRQVLINLISNAVKYTNSNTTVTIKYNNENNIHKISIEDQGNGISINDQKKIFEGYYRTIEAIKGDETGSGLGLFLADKIARMHGGYIELFSVIGKGSIFTLILKD